MPLRQGRLTGAGFGEGAGMSIPLFRRAFLSVLGVAFLVVGLLAIGPAGVAKADPPEQAENGGNGNGRGEGSGGGQGSGNGQGASNSQGSGNGQGSNNGQGASNSQGSSNGQSSGNSQGASNGQGSGNGQGASNSQGSSAGDGDAGASGEENGTGPQPCPPASPNAGGTQPCGHGPDGDGDDVDRDGVDDDSVVEAAARASWSGDVSAEIARVAGASAEADVSADVDLPADTDAAVMGVSAERASAAGEQVALEDLELAREGTSRSGGRSLLALTGMTLLGLVAAGLFLLAFGRLFRSAEQ